MKSRLFLIFSIFVLGAIIFSAFVYFFRAQADKVVENYIEKISNCSNISDEQSCYKNDFCEGIYTTSCPTCQDLEFKKCQRIAEKFLAQMNQEKEVCQKSGGQWYRNKLGSFCLCRQDGITEISDKGEGCS